MKIYVIGDSISIHYGPFLELYLRGVSEYSRKEGEEEALLNLDEALGANGGDSSMVLKFLKNKIAKDGLDSDYILINCGLHDIKTDIASGKKQVELDDYKTNLQAIVDEVAKTKAKLIWLRTTPCDENVHNNEKSTFYRFAVDCENYNKAADEIMQHNNIPSIDLYTFTKNLGDNLYCDHVHFHEHIREKQAAFISGWLNHHLKIPHITIKNG